MAAGSAGVAPPFGGMLQSMVEQTGALDQKAHEAVTGLMNGSGVEVHDAMIATQKADMAFELTLQVRNKMVGAYQQMMAMQF
jgi:flagellar hook-basal body complex protein FliE